MKPRTRSTTALLSLHLVLLPWVLAGAPLRAQIVLKWPGEPLATIETEHLRAFVPFAQREALRGLVARADRIFAKMCADARFSPKDRLRVLVADWSDAHNGYSFVTPFPLVQVELAPALPASTIFNGYLDTERTLIHEFAHDISNDRNHGFRGVLERIFGRVLPIDAPSLLLWYLSTPAHQTMPRFWQEGIGVWAETEYADKESVWRGRGRDSLTHMVWRLDVAADTVPAVGEWRVTYHEWPFGTRAYTYGTAYVRYLAGAFAGRFTLWDFIDAQAAGWAFLFDRGPRRMLGARHAPLLGEARAALVTEQQRVLATLRSAPVTRAERLTPADTLLGAPAVLPDGTVVVAAHPAQGRARVFRLRPDGVFRGSSEDALALGGIRTTRSGALVYHEFNWREIARVHVAGRTLGWRMLQPDAVELPSGDLLLAAVQLRDGGGQDVVVETIRDGAETDRRVVPARDVSSSPVFRPGGPDARELAWVEVGAKGSRLVLAPLADPTRRRVLVELAGRLLHPVFSADGHHLYYCADHTGVANAYRLTIPADAQARPVVVPVTNTIGGVVACVPAPDGRTLVIVDHDRRGPFLAKISAEPSSWAKTVPVIELAWPAPVSSQPSTQAQPRAAPTAFTLPPQDPAAAAATTVTPYNGLAELRPLFWAPTTFAVPEGGYGVIGLAADPIFSHIVDVGAGVGLVETQAVGTIGYTYLGAPIELGVRASRSELTFGDVVQDDTGELFDYTETVASGVFRFGRGLFALQRTLLLHAAVGIEDHDSVADSTERFQNRTIVSTPAFTGTDRFVEVTIGYDDSTFFPTSFAPEDGLAFTGVFRHSGLGGDLERNLAYARAGYVVSVAPQAGHQVVVRGVAGWSDGDQTLQGSFAIGGGLGRGFPRGYLTETQATGRHLLGGGLGYRFPVWRPFAGASTTPFRGRQLAIELFGDTAKVSQDRIGGDGDWFTSVGTELLLNVEFFDVILTPGLGVAWQLDGERDVEAYFTVGVSF